MTPLPSGEVVLRNDPPRLMGVRMLDRGFQALAKRVSLSQLTTEPAEETDLGCARYRGRSHDDALRTIRLKARPRPSAGVDRPGAPSTLRPSPHRLAA